MYEILKACRQKKVKLIIYLLQFTLCRIFFTSNINENDIK